MKSAITSLFFVLSLAAVEAVEYVTLTANTRSRAVAATDLVEIVGYSGVGNGEQRFITLSFADGTSAGIVAQGFAAISEGGLTTFNSLKGNQFTGLRSVAITATAGNPWVLTLKITTKAEREEVTSGVVTIPGNTGANYSVTMEKSTDLSNWQPAAPGIFTATATPQFFRVRIAPVPAP